MERKNPTILLSLKVCKIFIKKVFFSKHLVLSVLVFVCLFFVQALEAITSNPFTCAPGLEGQVCVGTISEIGRPQRNFAFSS